VDDGPHFCGQMSKCSLRRYQPGLFHSNQGPQFTSETFTGELETRQSSIRLDGRGRRLDNASSSDGGGNSNTSRCLY
jgi:transposase InsO family protein